MTYPPQQPQPRPYGPPPVPPAQQQPPYPPQYGYQQPPPRRSGMPVWLWVLLATLGVIAIGILAVGGIAESKPKMAAAGAGVRDGQFEFTVTKVEQGATTLGEGFWKTDAQGEFVLITVKVTNTGTENRKYFSGDQKMIDDKGRKFDADTSGDEAIPNNSRGFAGEDLNPGFSVERVIVFDVPHGTVPSALEAHDSSLSHGTRVALK